MINPPPNPTDSDLAALLPRLTGRRVLVLGDVMLDRTVRGEANRLSPEAPIPVLRAEGATAVPGGAGNVARNIAAMGGQAVLVGIAGQDGAAGELAAALAREGVEHRLVAVAGRPTTVKTRFMAGGHQLLRLDEEVTAPLPPAAAAAVLAGFTAALAGVEAVVLSDYAKGLLGPGVLAEAIAAARAAGLPIVVDPKRADFAAYAGATLLTPNLAEALRATGIAAADDAAAEAACHAALAAAAVAAVLLTRSAQGLTLLARDEAARHLPTLARAVADVTGAGDTLVAAVTLALAAGASLPQAAALGNLAAGLVVAKPGTATVAAAELAAALHRHEVLALDAKVMDRGAAIAQVRAWREAGLAVGFTNGCFDLIHPGHVRLLARARASCDRLVVALNSDASVRRLKGPARPVQGETARATVMASIAAADLVVLFEEDTPEALIEALRPEVLVKGADYRLDQVVGAAAVQSWGGRVVLVPLEEGHSTTGTIRRIGAGR